MLVVITASWLPRADPFDLMTEKSGEDCPVRFCWLNEQAEQRVNAESGKQFLITELSEARALPTVSFRLACLTGAASLTHD